MIMRKIFFSILILLVFALSPLYADEEERVIRAEDIEITKLNPGVHFSGASEFRDGISTIRATLDHGYMMGFMDDTGKIIYPLEIPSGDYGFDPYYSEGMAKITINDKWGYLDKTGKLVIPLEYDEAEDFHSGYARVGKYIDGQMNYGFIDKSGEFLLELLYSGKVSDRFYEGYARVGDHYLKADKRSLYPLHYSVLGDFSEGLAYAANSKFQGFINTSGDRAITLPFGEYSSVDLFKEGMARVLVNQSPGRKFGFIDRTGNLVVPVEYDTAYDFKEGRALVCKGEYPNIRCGYIDKTGKEITGLIYEYRSGSFSNGLALVGKGGKYGYIDKNGKVVIDIKYNTPVTFSEGLACVDEIISVVDGGKICDRYLMNTRGEVLLSEYDSITPFKNGLALARKSEGMHYGWYLLRIKPVSADVRKSPYIHGEVDKGLNLPLPIEELEKATEAKEILKLVKRAAGLTEEEVNSVSGMGILRLFLEEASIKLFREEKPSGELLIDGPVVEDQLRGIPKFRTMMSDNLRGINANTYYNHPVYFSVKDGKRIKVKLDPSKGWLGYSGIRIDAPHYMLSLSAELLFRESDNEIELIVEEEGSSYNVTLSKELELPLKLSLPVLQGDPQYNCVFDSAGRALGGKYNPITKKLEVKIKNSGKYTVRENRKTFSDIADKPEEMQEAIELLASKGIIEGLSADKFNPDGEVTRAEFAALILRMISGPDNKAELEYKDVKKTDWYYSAVAGVKRENLMMGVNKDYFSPKANINREQLVSIIARVLTNMNYSSPNQEEYLAAYTDAASISDWAKPSVALATKEGLVLKRYDSTFSPKSIMTRGDVAVILHRLYKKIW